MTGLKSYQEDTFFFKNVQVNCVDTSRRLGGDLFYFKSPTSGRLVWAATPGKARKLIKELV
jgi:hypothetical protein